MKAPPRYSKKYAKDPSVQGNMSVEDIIKRDWERNYKGKAGVTTQELENLVRHHIAAGGGVHRFRNTLFLVAAEDGDYEMIGVYCITGDLYELYVVALLTFLISMNQTQGTEEVHMYVPDKVMYRKLRGVFAGFMDIENIQGTAGGSNGYMLIVDLAGYIRHIQTASKQQGG